VTILGTKVGPFVLALLIGGCPKRQTVPRVVYVQAPPASAAAEARQPGGTNTLPKAANASPQASSAGAATEALVIEEPPPPPPPEPVAAQTPPPATPVVQTPRRRTRPRTEPHDTDEQGEAVDSAAAPSLGEAPSLEPQSDMGQNQLQAKVDEIKRRITELEKNSDLSTTEKRTLTDARSFWSQSVAALRDRDRLRAQELAQKASMLLAALEKK